MCVCVLCVCIHIYTRILKMFTEFTLVSNISKTSFLEKLCFLFKVIFKMQFIYRLNSLGCEVLGITKQLSLSMTSILTSTCAG